MVSTPREGGQSMSTMSYWSSTGSSARARTCSRPVRVNRWTSAPARSMVAGTNVEPGDVGNGKADVGHLGASDEDVVERLIEPVGIEAERERQAGLRIQVDHQSPAPQLGHGHAQRVHRGRLGHPALLVGHGQDVGHTREHRPVSWASPTIA